MNETTKRNEQDASVKTDDLLTGDTTSLVRRVQRSQTTPATTPHKSLKKRLSDLFNKIQNQQTKRRSTSTFQSILLEKYEILSRSLVASHALLFKLQSNDYMRDKVPLIRRQITAEQKVVELLNILYEIPDKQQQPVFSSFLSSLRQDGQEHVANVFQQESDARPMSDEHFRLVNKQQQVCQCLDPLDGLVDNLVARNVFSDTDKSIILSKIGYDMSREVINILLRKQDSAFDAFISALCATKQEHVASLLGHKCSEQPMREERRQMLISKSDELSQFINPTYSLLNKLVAADVFCRRDMGNVICKSSYSEMSIELINILLRKSDSSFDKFIEALNDTEQQHVVHILTGQGEPPLSHVRRLVLRKANKRLLSRVDPVHTSLLSELISSGVLTDDDKQRIAKHDVNEYKTSELIDIIARKSQLSYDKFLQALKDSGHSPVAKELVGLERIGMIDPHFLSDIKPAERSRIVSGKGDDIEELTILKEQNGCAVSEISEGSIRDL